MKSEDWSHQMRIRGTTPRKILLRDLGEYIAVFADLLGQKERVRFAGIGGGSAVIRASVDPESHVSTRARLYEAKLNPETDAGKVANRLGRQLARDRLDATVEDQTGVLLTFEPVVLPADQLEHTVRDSGVIDGVVVGIQGIDDTSHVRILDFSGSTSTAEITDDNLARRLAVKFRGSPVRLHVHGLWKRDANGRWSPHRVSVSSYEELDETSGAAVFREIRDLGAGGWGEAEDPEAEWIESR